MATLQQRLEAVQKDSAFKAAVWHLKNARGNRADVDGLLWLAALRNHFHNPTPKA